jgi:hypothetical protein
MLRADDFLITDDNYRSVCFDQQADGERFAMGLIPRNYSTMPVGSLEGSVTFAQAADVPLIPMNEWPDRIAFKVTGKSQLSDIRNTANNGQPIPSLDQNGRGYCWAHSATAAAILLRAVSGMPYVRLSAYAVACIIKNYRDQGGWGAQGLDFIRERGVPSVDYWPEKSVSPLNDKPETWENAARHKVSEGFIDLDAAQYDRRLTFQEVGTCLLCNIPVVSDFNWWGHSVCAMDLVDVEPTRAATDPRRYGVRIWNSWRDSWGTNGTGVLTGSKAIPDGATAPRSIVLSDS